MDSGLFDGAVFGDRYINRDSDIVIYQSNSFFNGRNLHKLFNSSTGYVVESDGSFCDKEHQYDVISRIDEDDDFVEAVALKAYPNDDVYKEIFKEGFKKGLKVCIV